MAVFSRQEIERRLETFRSRLGDSQVGIAFSFFNSYYLSGAPIIPWGRPTIAVLPKDSLPAYIVPAFERERAEEHSPIRDIRTYADAEGPNAQCAIRLVAEFLKERNLRRVAVEADGVSASMLEMLKAALPESRTSDISPVLEEMRLIQSGEEIALCRAATEIADVGVETFIAEARVGRPEVTLTGLATSAMAEHAARRFPEMETTFNCYCQQGMRSFTCHAPSSGQGLRAGELVELVVEAFAWHYQASVERAVLVGEPSREQRAAYEATLQAHDAALRAVRPGARFSDMDQAARDALKAAGYDRIDVGTGLSRGLVHEWGGRLDRGNLRVYNHNLLAPNMVITIEPWALVPGVGAPRRCDMVLVTPDGHELLSKARGGMIQI